MQDENINDKEHTDPAERLRREAHAFELISFLSLALLALRKTFETAILVLIIGSILFVVFLGYLREYKEHRKKYKEINITLAWICLVALFPLILSLVYIILSLTG